MCVCVIRISIIERTSIIVVRTHERGSRMENDNCIVKKTKMKITGLGGICLYTYTRNLNELYYKLLYSLPCRSSCYIVVVLKYNILHT